MAKSFEYKSALKFIGAINTMEVFNPALFAHAFCTMTSTAVQKRAMAIFLNIIQVWADRYDHDQYDNECYSLYVDSKRLMDSISDYNMGDTYDNVH